MPSKNPDEQPTEEIDHEAIALAAYQEKRNRYALFDQLIDVALDGAGVTVPEAIEAYKTEVSGGR